MGEVKQGIGGVFEGEVGVSPHTRSSSRVISRDLRALQQLSQVNLPRKNTILPLKTTIITVEKNPKTTEARRPAYIHPVALPSNRGDGPVQASLQLPPDERVSAVDGHHVRPWNDNKGGETSELCCFFVFSTHSILAGQSQH